MGIDRYASTIFLGIFKKGTVEVIKLKSFPYSATSINSYKFRLLGIHIFHQGFLFPNASYNLCFHVSLLITCAKL